MAANDQNAPISIAYLTSNYPSVSHTFIRREIQGLEALGYEVDRISIRPSDHLVDEADIEESRKTWQVLDSPIKVGLGALATFLSSPLRSVSALREAITMGKRSDRGVTIHLVYWIEAAAIIRQLRAKTGPARARPFRNQSRRGRRSHSYPGRSPVQLYGPRTRRAG